MHGTMLKVRVLAMVGSNGMLGKGSISPIPPTRGQNLDKTPSAAIGFGGKLKASCMGRISSYGLAGAGLVGRGEGGQSAREVSEESDTARRCRLLCLWRACARIPTVCRQEPSADERTGQPSMSSGVELVVLVGMCWRKGQHERRGGLFRVGLAKRRYRQGTAHWKRGPVAAATQHDGVGAVKTTRAMRSNARAVVLHCLLVAGEDVETGGAVTRFECSRTLAPFGP